MKREAAASTANRITAPRHYRALKTLLEGPKTVRELYDIVGGNGMPQLIDLLRINKNVLIETIWHQGQDRDKRTVRYGTYHLDPASREAVQSMLADYERREL